MKLSLLLIGWFLHTSSAFTFVTRTRFQVRNNYDRLSFYSTTSDQQLLTEDTDFIQKNIEFASTTSTLVDTDRTIATSTNVQNRFDRVVGPKRALIYDTTLRGRCFIILYFYCCIVILPLLILLCCFTCLIKKMVLRVNQFPHRHRIS